MSDFSFFISFFDEIHVLRVTSGAIMFAYHPIKRSPGLYRLSSAVLFHILLCHRFLKKHQGILIFFFNHITRLVLTFSINIVRCLYHLSVFIASKIILYLYCPLGTIG